MRPRSGRSTRRRSGSRGRTASTRPSRAAAALPPRTRTDRDPVAAPDLQAGLPQGARARGAPDRKSLRARPLRALARDETFARARLRRRCDRAASDADGAPTSRRVPGLCSAGSRASASSGAGRGGRAAARSDARLRPAPTDRRGSCRGKEQRQRAWLGRKAAARQPCPPGLGSDAARRRSARRRGRRHRWMPRARGRRGLLRGRGTARRHQRPARGRGAAPQSSRQQAGARTACPTAEGGRGDHCGA